MKRGLTILAILLIIVLMVTACGGTKETPKPQGGEEKKAEVPQNTSTESPKAEKTDSAKSAASDSKLKTIADFSELWNNLFKENEAVINAYDGMPIMELVLPGTCFITGVQYDLLNMDNKNGRFEGELMLAGYKGFIEKDGAKLTFGYDDVLDKDGFAPTMKAGDRKVETGNCDLDKVYYFSESYSERNGSKIESSVSELRQEKDGSISCFMLSGHSLDFRGEESIRNEAIFVRNGKNQYDFVVAKAEIGPNFEIISLKDNENITKEQAIKMFQDAGFTLEMSGGIVDGKLTLD